MIASNPLPPKRPVRIVIADDHKFYRDGFKINLCQFEQVHVVADAEDGAQSLKLVAEQLPDIVFMNVNMPVMDGITATREIRSRFPYIHVIAVSGRFSDEMITDVIEAGASGYLLKNTTGQDVIEAIERVLNGGIYYCTEVANRVVELNMRTGFNPLKPFDRPEFTEPEKNIIIGICDGLTNKEIAARLGMDTRQVERAIDRIMEKINRVSEKKCTGRTCIAMFAVRHHMYKA